MTLISLRDLQTALDSSGAITDYGKIQYLCTLLRGGSLHEFETLFEKIGHTTNKNLNRIILGLGTYFFPINYPSEKNHTMWCGMRKQSELKVRQYAAYLIKTNGCFIFLDLNPKQLLIWKSIISCPVVFLINEVTILSCSISILKRCILKRILIFFYHMEIAEYINEGVVEPSYIYINWVRHQPCSTKQENERNIHLVKNQP